MRVPPGVEEDQMPGMRADERTIALYGGYVGCVRVVREGQFAAGQMIGAKEQPGQRVGVDVALEPHRCVSLHIEHDAVTVVACRHDGLRASLGSEFEELAPIRLVQPGHPPPHLIGMDAAAPDVQYVSCLARQDWRAGKLSKIGLLRRHADVLLPAGRKVAVEVERGPVESRRHEPHLLFNSTRAVSLRTGVLVIRDSAPCEATARCARKRPELRAEPGVVVLVAVLGRWTGVVLCHGNSSSRSFGGLPAPSCSAGYGMGKVRRLINDYR